MPDSSLKAHHFWLNNKIPLIGGWLRQWSARTLAASPADDALEILAQAYEHPDANVRAITQAHLETIEASQPAVDAICRAWYSNRSPALGVLLEQRSWVAANPPNLTVYSALRANRIDLLGKMGAVIVRPLVNAAGEKDPLIAGRAVTCLKSLSSQAAINALCEMWVQSRKSSSSDASRLQRYLEWLLQTAGYIASAPPQVRVLSALKASQPEKLADSRLPAAPLLVDALSDADPEIARAASKAIAGLQRPETRDAVCKHFLDGEYPGLEEAIVTGGFLPSHASERALFLFLSRQWVRYEGLDFDHSLMRTIYEAANPTLRERIIRALRQAGRVNFLSIITGSDETERIQVMGPADFDLLVNLLTNNQEWLRLWMLAQKVPPAWGVRILQSLSAASWQPDDPAGQALFNELVTLIGDPQRNGLLSVLQSLNRQTPPAIERARLHLRHGKLNSAAFDPHSHTIALVSSRRRVVLWNYQSGEVTRVIKTTSQGERFKHSLGEVCYTKNGNLVFAERTRSEEFCKIYAEVQGEVRPIFNETGSITALAPVGGGSFLAAGRSMFVSRLDLENTAQPAVRQYFTDWSRGIAISADSKNAALLQQGVTLVRTENLERIAWGYGGGQVIPCAAFSPDGKTIIAGRLNGQVHLFRNNDYLDIEKRGLPHHRGPVRGIIAFQKFPLILTAGADGMMFFTTWPERKRYGVAGRDGDTIAGLTISADESSLAVIHGEDSIALWDLRPLELPSLLGQALISLSPIQFASLQGIAALDGLPPDLHKAVVFSILLLKHRFRYDVEIEASPEIAAGEFDIEIGDAAEVDADFDTTLA